MKTNSPLKGLMIYAALSVWESLTAMMIFSAVLGAAMLVTGNFMIFSFFVGMTMGFAPLVLIIGLGSGKAIIKWERFQITMPVRRADLAAAQYVSLLLVSVIGVVVVGLFTGISVAIHDDLLQIVMKGGYLPVVISFGLPLVTMGLWYPLCCTKVGDSKGEALFLVCSGFAVAFLILIHHGGSRLGFDTGVTTLVMTVVAVVAYAVSYFITKRLYEKIDF